MMARHYDTIAELERDGFTIIVDKTWEDLDPKDCFDDTVTDIAELRDRIDAGVYDWFMMRVRVFYAGIELNSEYVSGLLYKDASEVMSDGTAEELIEQCLYYAKKEARQLSKKFADLAETLDTE